MIIKRRRKKRRAVGMFSREALKMMRSLGLHCILLNGTYVIPSQTDFKLNRSSWSPCSSSCGSASQSRWSRCADSAEMMDCIQVEIQHWWWNMFYLLDIMWNCHFTYYVVIHCTGSIISTLLCENSKLCQLIQRQNSDDNDDSVGDAGILCLLLKPLNFHHLFNVFQSQAGLEKKVIRTCRLDPCPTIM